MTLQRQGQRQLLPYMTILISLLCVLMRIVYEFLSPLQRRILVDVAGANPTELSAALTSAGAHLDGAGWSLLVLALFIHSGWLHLAGNLAYLWVFGIPVERRLGALSLFVIFVLGGTLAHVMVALRLPQLDLPVIGASGAVSAVVGAYLGLFPRQQIGL
jgi:membrane associated rhomboid family serine protease